MSMTSAIILHACGIILALTIGYSFWIKVRVLRLKADILTILADVRDEFATAGIPDNSDYRAFEQFIRVCLDRAPSISIPTSIYLIFKQGAYPGLMLRESPFVPFADERAKAIIESGDDRLVQRLRRYLTYETLCGLLLFPILKSLPRFSKTEMRHSAPLWLEPEAVYPELACV